MMTEAPSRTDTARWFPDMGASGPFFILDRKAARPQSGLYGKRRRRVTNCAILFDIMRPPW